MSDPNDKHDIKAALDFAESRAATEVLAIEHDGWTAPLVIAHGPAGAVVVDAKAQLDKFRIRPERRLGTISVDDLASFVAMTNRDKDADSVIFAGRDAKNHPYLVAVLDFHEAHATREASHDAKPRFCEDKIRYAFPLSDEWKTWTGIAGQLLDQAKFAAFIEDHIFDIGEPGAAGTITDAFASKLGLALASPQALMAVSRGLEVRSNQRVKSAINLENGDVAIQFETTETDAHGAPLKVPAAFHLLIPVFKNGPNYSIPVRLRRRAQGSSLAWFFELHRADLFLDDAIKDAIAVVEEPEAGAADETGGCGVTVMLGTPPHGAT